MRRREAIALILNAVGLPHHAFAQERTKIARVGYLGPAPAENFARRVEALRAGLRDFGYIEGINLSFEFRWANAPDELPDLAAELIRARVDVIVVPSSTETAAVLKTTNSVPVVFTAHADPIGVGHIHSLARPGANATGMSMFFTEVVAKELEALKEALPNARRFGVVFVPTVPSHPLALEAAQRTAQTLGVELQTVPVRADEDFPGAFSTLTQGGVDGLLVLLTPFTISRRELLAHLAIEHRLPTVFGSKDNVHAGGLLSYAPDTGDMSRQAARYVHRILQGAKPADLPVEQASRFELTINLKTAKSLGLKIPPTLLARADEVIE
jgi:putative tryptophan/tyrosine transport system substrate-binding protein